MEFFPIISQVASSAMDNLRETIHENEALNQLAHQVRVAVKHVLNSQALQLHL